MIFRAEASPDGLVDRGKAALVTYLLHRDAWVSLDRLKEVLESQAVDT